MAAAVHALLLEGSSLKGLTLELLGEQDLGTHLFLGDEDVLEDEASKDTTDDGADPVDPVVLPGSGNDGGTEGAGRVEGATSEGSADHDVDEDGETDRERGETTDGLGVSSDTGSREHSEDEDEGEDALSEDTLGRVSMMGGTREGGPGGG